jgi:hypothetical protein
MALVLKDRVRETSTTVGTGAYSLAGAVTGFQSFSVVGNSNTTYYAATDGTSWEVGIGTYTSSGTTLSRDVILESSNGGSAVSWGAGSKDVFLTYPAERSVYTEGGILGTGVSSALTVNVGSSGAVVVNGGALGTPSSGNVQNCTADGTDSVGFKNIPQNSESAAYELVLADAGKHILHPSADTTARTFTIPANGSVAFPIGTAVTFINQNGAGVVTIAITTDTMRLAGPGTTGSRTLAANGIATAVKITSTEWIISGVGLT